MNKHRIINALQASGLIPPACSSAASMLGGHYVPSKHQGSRGHVLRLGQVRLGQACFISVGCFFDGSAEIVVGDDVHIAPGVKILTSSHEEGPASRRAGVVTRAGVTIGGGCWIGAGAMILPGLNIAPGCIIAAGALVTKSTKPNGSYRGIPATRDRELS